MMKINASEYIPNKTGWILVFSAVLSLPISLIFGIIASDWLNSAIGGTIAAMLLASLILNTTSQGLASLMADSGKIDNKQHALFYARTNLVQSIILIFSIALSSVLGIWFLLFVSIVWLMIVAPITIVTYVMTAKSPSDRSARTINRSGRTWSHVLAILLVAIISTSIAAFILGIVSIVPFLMVFLIALSASFILVMRLSRKFR